MRLLVLIVMVTTLPIGLLGIASALAYEEPEGAGRVAVFVALSLLPPVLILPISGVAATVATMDLLGGRRASLDRSFDPVGARFWPLAATLAITAVAVAAGFVALVIPGVYLLVIWLFGAQAAVIERLSPRAALERSADLVRGGWWSVFAAFVVIQGLTAIVQVAIALPVAAAIDGAGRAEGMTSPSDLEIVVNGLWGIVASVAVQPFAAVALALLYLDRRARKEGAWPGPLQWPPRGGGA